MSDARAAHEKFHRERRRKAIYHVHVNASGKYRWELHDEKGVVIAVSPQAVATPEEAERQIQKIRDVGPYAQQRTESSASAKKRA